MSVITELMELPGVLAAGDFAYRGDQYYEHRGDLSDREVRLMSRLSRANLQAVSMQGRLLKTFARACQPDKRRCGFDRTKGWVMHGADRSVCVLSNVYCAFDNKRASLNQILGLMQRRLADAPDDLV